MSEQPFAFWRTPGAGPSASSAKRKKALRDLVTRMARATPLELYEAIEAGVPARLVELIASATDVPRAEVARLLGVSPRTVAQRSRFRAPLPECAGHRLAGLLAVMTVVQRMLDESGDPQQMDTFDSEAWVMRLMPQAQPQCGGRPFAELLRNAEGLRAIEQVLQRMQSGAYS